MTSAGSKIVTTEIKGWSKSAKCSTNSSATPIAHHTQKMWSVLSKDHSFIVTFIGDLNRLQSHRVKLALSFQSQLPITDLWKPALASTNAALKAKAKARSRRLEAGPWLWGLHQCVQGQSAAVVQYQCRHSATTCRPTAIVFQLRSGMSWVTMALVTLSNCKSYCSLWSLHVVWHGSPGVLQF